MSAPTYEKRRKVAERLRRLRHENPLFSPILTASSNKLVGIAWAFGIDIDEEWDAAFGAMADLVDPPCTCRDNEVLMDRCRELEAENARLKAEIGRIENGR